MKTKIFFKLNIFWQIICMFFLACPVSVIYFTIDDMINGRLVLKFNIFTFVVIIGLIFCIYTFITLELPVVLKKDCIFMPSDMSLKSQKIQFKVSIRYDEIEQIRLIHTTQNSLGGRIPRYTWASELTYMEFLCKDGKRKRIFVLYHTKRQRIKMINEIKIRMKQVGNNAEIGEATEIVNNIIEINRHGKKRKGGLKVNNIENEFLELLYRNEEFVFYYKNVRYEIVHGCEEGGTLLYLDDGSKTGLLIGSFSTYDEFLNNAIINGMKIKDILNEIKIGVNE